MKNRALLFAGIVWICAEAILQIHGLRFWDQHGGWGGWLWSPVLGIVTVWFWLHPSATLRWMLGIIASLLLLVGPLWQIGAPLVESAAQYRAAAVAATLQLQVLRTTEAELVETQNTYRRNSQDPYRSGWAAQVNRVEATLANIRQQIVTVAAAPPPQRTPWLSQAVLVIQMFALLTLQVAAVTALGVIRTHREAARMKDYIATLRPATQPRTAEPQRNTATQRDTETQHRNATQQHHSAPLSPLAEKIAAGAYGPEPKQRRVMAGEDIKRHPPVKKAFDELIECGRMLREGQVFRLVG